MQGSTIAILPGHRMSTKLLWDLADKYEQPLPAHKPLKLALLLACICTTKRFQAMTVLLQSEKCVFNDEAFCGRYPQVQHWKQ